MQMADDLSGARGLFSITKIWNGFILARDGVIRGRPESLPGSSPWRFGNLHTINLDHLLRHPPPRPSVFAGETRAAHDGSLHSGYTAG